MVKFNVTEDKIQISYNEAYKMNKKDIEEKILGSDSENEVIAQFESLELAKKFAMEEMKNITSGKQEGYCSTFVEVEYLMIEEVEYDEDEDVVDSQIWNVMFDMPQFEMLED